MVRRPRFVESAEKPRALLAAFAEVPGPTATGVRAEQLLLGFSEDVDFDALTLKGASLTHIQRVGSARMMRVPVPEAGRGDSATAFRERLAAFRRALVRQLENDRYDVVFCLDLFSASTAAPLLREAQLVVDVADVPSLSFATRWPVADNDDTTRQAWDTAEKTALRAARLVMVPSRLAGRALSERTDPRLLRAAPRLVDTRRFRPPSVELALDEQRTVAVLGGRELRRAAATAELVQRLARRLPDARLLLVGHPDRGSTALTETLTETLSRRNLLERVVVVDIPTAGEAAQVLQTADLVVVPAGGPGDAWGIPHRVLEAMACERAVVVGGTEAAYKDAVADGIHLRIVDGSADDLARTVRELLSHDDTRRALARAGRKQSQGFDLAGRLPEIAQILQETTGIRFAVRLPPLDGETADSTPAAPPVRRASSVVVAVPPAAVSTEYSDGNRALPEARRTAARRTSSPPAAVEPVAGKGPGGGPPGRIPTTAAASASAASPVAPPRAPTLTSPSTATTSTGAAESVATSGRPAPLPMPLPVPLPVALRGPSAGSAPASLATASPDRQVPTPAAIGPPAARSVALSDPAARAPDSWSGDTTLEPASTTGLLDGARVKAALLQTTSGDAVRRPVAAARTAEGSSTKPRPSGGHGPRSVSLVIDAIEGDDDWSRDTVADASPLEQSTPSPRPQDKGQTHLPAAPASLFDVVSEPTAEDREPER